MPAPSDSNTLSDAILVARVRAGDSVAFEAIFRRHGAAVLRFAASCVGDMDAADDLLQDVFAWVWHHRDRWDPHDDVLAYLLTSVRNRARNHARNAARRASAAERIAAETDTPAMGEKTYAPDVAAEVDEQRAQIREAMQRLTDVQHMLCTLRWEQGMAWEQAAAIVGITPAAARQQHSRALATLRALLPTLFE